MRRLLAVLGAVAVVAALVVAGADPVPPTTWNPRW